MNFWSFWGRGREKPITARGVRITGLGTYLPTRRVTSEEFAETLNKGVAVLGELGLISRPPEELTTSGDWIHDRTGIGARHLAAPDQAPSDLAAEAVRNCQGVSGLSLGDRGIFVVATTFGDHIASPPTGPLILGKLGWPARNKAGKLVDGMTADVGSACTSFLAGLFLTESAIRSGNRETGYVVGVDILPRIVHPLAREIAVLFGDGAAAMSLRATNDPKEDSFLPGGNSFYFGSDGRYANLIRVAIGGAKQPATLAELEKQGALGTGHKLSMEGRKVFEVVVKLVPEIIEQALAKAGLKLGDIDLFVLHQANLRILEAVAKKMRLGDRIHNNIQEVGNTTSASLGLCLRDAQQKRKLNYGDRVMLVAFGGGFTWGTCIFRWTLAR